MKGIPAILLFIVSFLLFYSLVGYNQPIYAIPDFNFAADGDWGCSSNTQSTVNNINGRNPELALALGDYSYQSSATCWLTAIQPIDGVTRINIGNHENQVSEDFNTYMNHFGLSNPYYSYNYQNIHVLTIATESSFSSGSSQYNFVVNDLQTASQNPNIKWIIVNFHKVMYTSPNTCGSSSCSNSGTTAQSLRNTYHALFDQYGVDLVLQGHVHNYQRTYPIKYSGGSSPTITDSNSNNYVDPQGEIFATVGTGGVNFHALSGKAAFVVSQQDTKFGALNLDFTNNGTKVTGKFFANDGALMDQFTITKPAANIAPITNNQAVSVSKNTAKAVTLTASDPNNDPLTYSIVTQPAHGTLTGTAPNLNYNPDANYVGADSFTFKANDGTVDSNIATVSITVQDPASCTTNLAISGITASGSESSYPPSNAIDNNFGTRWAADPDFGSWIRVDLGSTQNICSVGIAWYNGNQRQYHFIIATSTDGSTFTNVFSGDSSGTTASSEKYIIPATDARYVRVTINGNTVNIGASIFEIDIFGSGTGNSPPIANNQAVSVSKNTAKAVTLTASDPNNDPLTYSIVTQPAHGTLTGTAPNLNYNPDANYVGADSFTFKANDGTVGSNIATVSITVQDPASCTTNLAISGITASGSESSYPPSNAIDNNFGTRWAADPDFGSWIRVDLGSTQNICSVGIAWYNGNQRQYHFIIATSTDGSTFTNVFSGDSSGTTASSEKYIIPATDARYVRVTINGNTVNIGASIFEIDIFDPNNDQFGIMKLYPTKSNGEEWYMNMNNPLGDSRFNPQNTITKNPDGSWKMKSSQVRMNVYTSTGYDSANIPTLDHSEIASNGYMLRDNDWRNFEMTQYVKVNTSPSDDNFAPYGRGGRHTGSGPPEGCEGSSIKGDVFFSGKVRFAKEQWHVSYVFTNLKSVTSSIEDKWVGIKFIVYNFVENNKIVVKTELWLDTNNSGNFVKVDENVDRGGWGTEGVQCGGTPDQIISWGGPITTFRWDSATDVDFKNLSVREIVPPQ